MTAPVLVVEHEPDTGLSLMTEHLAGHVEVVRPYRGEAFGPLAGFRGLIVLGGAMGAGDDEVAPWLPATRRLLVDAVRAQLPTLGICLGAQLLAVACGGTVERGDEGLELGVVPVVPLPAVAADPFFGAVQQALGAAGEPWPVHQYHYDAVTRLPADTELLVTSDAYPHQGFRVGPAAWGVQYHPEVSTALFAEWVGTGLRTGELPPGARAAVEASEAGAAVQARTAEAHARAFLEVGARVA